MNDMIDSSAIITSMELLFTFSISLPYLPFNVLYCGYYECAISAHMEPGDASCGCRIQFLLFTIAHQCNFSFHNDAQPKEKQVGYQQTPDGPVTWAKFYALFAGLSFLAVAKNAPLPSWYYGYDNTKCTKDFKY